MKWWWHCTVPHPRCEDCAPNVFLCQNGNSWVSAENGFSSDTSSPCVSVLLTSMTDIPQTLIFNSQQNFLSCILWEWFEILWVLRSSFASFRDLLDSLVPLLNLIAELSDLLLHPRNLEFQAFGGKFPREHIIFKTFFDCVVNFFHEF